MNKKEEKLERLLKMQEHPENYTEEEIRQLKVACRLHTTKWKTEDATVNACFDADRLDLGRVGITPNPDKMATLQGRILAERLMEDSLEDDWILNGG